MAGLLSGLDMASPYIQMGTQYLMDRDAAKRQNRENRKLAEYQNSANLEYMRQQNAYNTPQMQMQRFKEAGLNPNLIYGQGTPGNQSSSVQAADIKPTDYQSMAKVLPLLNQTRMVNSQVQATDAKTRQTTVMTELNKVQKQVLEKNPLLNDTGFTAIIDSLKSSAEIKASESGIRESQMWVQQNSANHQVNTVFRNLELLEQRFKLGEQDLSIKAEVLKSKEFQNALLDIQKQFMQDANITPGHILQFVQLLLLKLL